MKASNIKFKRDVAIIILIIITMFLCSIGYLKYIEMRKNNIAHKIKMNNLEFKIEKPIMGSEIITQINKINDYNSKNENKEKIDLDIVVDINNKEYKIPLKIFKSKRIDQFLDAYGNSRFKQESVEYYQSGRIKKIEYRIVYNY